MSAELDEAALFEALAEYRRCSEDQARGIIGAYLTAREPKQSERTWAVWVCPACNEIVTRAGTNGRCAGSATEGTAHASVGMRAAVVCEVPR